MGKVIEFPSGPKAGDKLRRPPMIPDFDRRIKNIMESLARINALMEELKETKK